MIQDIHDRLVDEIRGSTNRDHRKLANNTYGRIEGDRVIVKLHDTDILESTADTLTLNTGGWFTVTTKERLHRYTPGLSIQSVKSVWFVSTQAEWAYDDARRAFLRYPGRTLSRFFDGMVLRDGPDGIYVEDAVLDDPDMDLRKAIEGYVKLYTDERLLKLVEAARASPPNGDCLYCQMGGGPGVGGDHLLLHIGEGYVMVTLAANAVKAAGYKPEIYLGTLHESNARWQAQTIRRAIRKYMRRHLLNRGLRLLSAEELEAV